MTDCELYIIKIFKLLFTERTIKMKLDTICVQGTYKPKNGEPRVIPIVQSTTFKYDSSAEMDAGKNSESGGGHHFFSEPPVVRAS